MGPLLSLSILEDTCMVESTSIEDSRGPQEHVKNVLSPKALDSRP